VTSFIKILSCGMLFSLMAAVHASAAPLPGQTLVSGSDATLQRDVLADLFTAEKALSGGCKKSRVVDTRIVKAPKTLAQERGTGLAVAQWTERWTMDRCGKKVFYVIRFDMRGSAGTTFNIQAP
jgi:hypothetical protein